MQAYILLKCVTGLEKNIIDQLKRIPEVVEVNGIWGKYDIFVKVSSSESNGIDKAVEQIRSNKDITDTYTMHVLYGQGGSIDEKNL